MYYVADCYVRVDKKLLKRGEILPKLPEEKIRWLLEAGAIHACDPEPIAEYTMSEEEFTEMMADIEDDEQEEESEEPVQTDTVEEAELMEAEVDLPEAPEIDAMEGIVVDETKTAPKKSKAAKPKKEGATK